MPVSGCPHRAARRPRTSSLARASARLVTSFVHPASMTNTSIISFMHVKQRLTDASHGADATFDLRYEINKGCCSLRAGL